MPGKKQIIKAEILWTRHCPWQCSGCNMVHNDLKETTEENVLELWKKGMDNLKEIGCQFTAIYGAEPLTRMKNLPELIAYQRSIGIEQTIITALNNKPRIDKLITEGGLQSVSVSWDIKTEDPDRNTKMENGIQLLQQLDVPDRACIITLTQENQDYVMTQGKEVLDKGYWLLFDIIHPGYDLVLSKCEGDVPPPDVDAMRRIADTFIEWKRQGLRVHASEAYFNYVKDRYNGKVRSVWHCKSMRSIGWLTLDWDGSILPCDDFQRAYMYRGKKMKIWDDIDWDDFYRWRKLNVLGCPGCAWNTHWDAEYLTMNDDTGTYIHLKSDR